MKDIYIAYVEKTGGDIAKIVSDKLALNGYTISMHDAVDALDVVAMVYIITDPNIPSEVFEAKEKGVAIIPVWPNNCPQVNVGGLGEISTLDMVGTDFELSLDKVCERFPESLRKKNDFIRRNILDGFWTEILCEYPELSSICKWDAIDDWPGLLKVHPQFADKCEWGKLTKYEWEELLSERPEFIRRCNTSMLDGGEWTHIIVKQPTLAEQCNWDSVNNSECPRAGSLWVQILSAHPDFAVHCNWARLDGGNWVDLLKSQPCFAGNCNWSILKGNDWANLLSISPDYESKCNWAVLGADAWATLLSARPEYDGRCDWRKLSGRAWATLVSKRPEYVAKCEWRKLSGQDWCQLLLARPEFSDKCPWSVFSGAQWATLLTAQPQLAEHCRWNRLDAKDWFALLRVQPQFADRCVWSQLQGMPCSLWIRFLEKQPQFASYCDGACICGNGCARLIIMFPDIGRRFEWSMLSGADEVSILKKHPMLADKCDWSRLKNKDWDVLLACKPEFSKFRNVLRTSKDDDLIFDVFICCAPTAVCVAKRLGTALEKRGYSVFVNENMDCTEISCRALQSAKHFMIVRSEDLFPELIKAKSALAILTRGALNRGKRLVVIGPTELNWRTALELPNEFKTIETEQVKNLEAGDLFEEKVDAIVRESLRGERGSLSKHYDVFISYRRSTGASVARRLHQQLKSLGYLSFLDYDCILNGKYDKVILSAIDSAPVFIPVLTERSLDRCVESGDWVAAEIKMAIENKKCIIPVSPDNQDCSIRVKIPFEINALCDMQRCELQMDHASFGDSVAKIVQKFPEDLRAKGAEILSAIKAPSDEHLYVGGGDPEKSPLVRVLRKYPDVINLVSHRKFDGGMWRMILLELPELASACDWAEFTPMEIVDIISVHPELVSYVDFSMFDGGDWACLLSKRSEFADRCEWGKFRGIDWDYLYEFAKDVALQYESKQNSSLFCGGNWVCALKSNPIRVKECEWGKFSGHDVRRILEAKPEWIKLIGRDYFERMDNEDLAALLCKCPSVISWCKQEDLGRLTGDNWVSLILNNEDFALKCDWYKLNGRHWAYLVCKYPNLIEKCREYANGCDWADLDAHEWRALLAKYPEFDRLNVSGREVLKDSSVDDNQMGEFFYTYTDMKHKKTRSVVIQYSS